MSAGSTTSPPNRKSTPLFWSAVVVAIALRIVALRWPPNYDLESWNIVADIVLNGKNVYAGTERYNYGPAWAGILAILKIVSGLQFRFAICLALSAVDVAIAAFLRKRAGIAAALAFLFAPWSILITGHHGQFDNLAVLIGLLSVGYTSSRLGYRAQGLQGLSNAETVMGAALLGASLVLKHLLFVFPFWMAFRVPDLRKRLLWLVVPFGMFAASFIPFWSAGHEGIVAHVLRHTTDFDAPFLNTFGPAIIDTMLGCKPHTRIERYFFYSALLLAGALLRRRSLLELLAFYTALLVVFSSGVWNHYLAIPVLFTALYRNAWSIAFQLLAIPFYILHHDAFRYGEGLAANSPGWKKVWDATELWGHNFFIALLAFAVVYELWAGQIRRAVSWLSIRIREALQGVA